MPTITIYVSEDAEERINKWRDRLNLSDIARRAIMAEIGELEHLSEVPDDLSALVARLRKEKAETETTSYQQGYNAGLAESADPGLTGFTYDEFLELERNMEPYNRWGTPPDDYWPVLPGSIRGAFNDLNQEANLWEGYDKDEWLRGYVDGVLTTWDEVRGQL